MSIDTATRRPAGPAVQTEPLRDTALLTAAEMAVIETVRFDALNPGLKALLTLAEAACSCALDGIDATAEQILLATLSPVNRGPAGEIVATALAVARTSRGQAMLNGAGLRALNRAVSRGGFTPSAPDLEELASFASRADVPILAQAALLNARAEQELPFEEANGRTARVLVQAMLRAAGVTSTVPAPLSAGLRVSAEGHRDAMRAYRRGDGSPVIKMFIEAAFVSLDNCNAMAEQVKEAEAEHRELLGRTRSPAALGILPQLTRTPALTAAVVMSITGASDSAAYRVLEQLTDAGILQTAPKVHGSRAWTAPRIVSALEGFLERSKP